ncbi:MAG: S41 family peptidase [bacterium]|nr:S41 family peptidase [bacterium]
MAIHRTLPISRFRSAIVIFSLLLLSAGIGYRFGERRAHFEVTPDRRLIVNQDPPPQLTVDFSLFWDVWQRLNRDYIDAASLNPQKMVEGAITGMVGSLDDPYTSFLPAQENKEFKEELGGAFEGIGAQLGLKDNRIIVIAPLDGTPAQKAGIRPSDWILKVNDEETIGWSIQEAVTKIRGPGGTEVTLEILHEKDEDPVKISIIRGTIAVPSVKFWVKAPSEITEISGVDRAATLLQKTDKIAYLQLNRFGDRTNDEWEKAIRELLKAKETNGSLSGVVFDLRNNPGGYLDGSVYIASEFVRDGIIVSQVNSDGTKEEYPVRRRGRLLTIPIVVLINKGSASASEIVAGALRDHKRATIVGETSFGKGSVQTPQDLPGGAGIHITTGKWLLPNGDSISKKGITPDVAVSLDSYEATMDAQLAKAVELLLQ